MSPNLQPRLRILAVDEDEMVRETLRRVVEDHGHHVEEASNANDALYMLQGARFDLVITDYDMPGMRGDRLAGRQGPAGSFRPGRYTSMRKKLTLNFDGGTPAILRDDAIAVFLPINPNRLQFDHNSISAGAVSGLSS